MKIKLLLTACFACIHLLSYAQNFPKWGKLSEQEIKLTVCPFDSAATAVVLADYGKIIVDYPYINVEHHCRIKILDKKGLDQATKTIPYFYSGKTETISKIEAQTINIGKDGKTIITEIPKNQIYDVDVTANWHEKRFSFPSVEVGSILEYKYRTITQDFYFLDGWTFQADIPTIHSEISVKLLRNLNYRALLQGSQLTKKYRADSSLATTSWSLDNIPALEDESYVANYRDYVEKLQFQIADFLNTWDKISEEFLQSSSYVNFLNRSSRAQNILNQIIASTDSDIAKVQKIYKYVQTNYAWNGEHRIFPEQLFNKFLDTKQGSNVEINLFLTLLLQEANLKAAPALSSTRKHGKVQQTSAMITQFNQVLACVTVDSKDVLLNATDPLRPYPLLDEQDLNWYALVLDKPQSRWIKIEQASSAKETVYADINLENPAKPIYNFSVRYEGYSAIDNRRKFHRLGEQKFIDQQKGFFTDKKLVKFEKENQDKPDEALLHKYQLELEEVSDKQNLTIYFQPVLWHHFQENPFKGTKRNLPIELDYPSSFQFILNLRIPEGYQVQELPKATLVTLPDNMGTFRYQTTVKDSQLQLFTNVQFKTVFIPAYYYSHLQQFYDQIIGKYQEMIVLKKK